MMKNLTLLAFILIPFCIFAQPMSQADTIPEVKVQNIKIIDEFESSFYGARLEPLSSRVHNCPFEGTITSIYVSEGQKINKGAALFSISRATQTSVGDYVPLTVYAFSSGIVSSINIERGEEVSPGKEAITVANITSLKAVLYVSDKDIKDLSKDMLCYDTKDSSIYGTITKIPLLPETKTNLFPVEVQFTNQDSLFAGKFISLRIPVKPLRGAYVPTQSIISRYGKKFVYTISDNTAHLQEISQLKTSNNRALVSGLQDGDKVAISNTFLLSEGKTIKIVE